MAGGQFLNDDIINWILTWWRSEIGGGQNNNKNTTPQAHPDLPRCYHANTHWFTKLQEGGATERFLKWTDKTNLDKDYDLMLIPINTSNHHWYLAVIDFKNKHIATYDSHEPKETRNTTTPAMPETYSTLRTWLLKRHEAIYESRFLTEVLLLIVIVSRIEDTEETLRQTRVWRVGQHCTQHARESWQCCTV